MGKGRICFRNRSHSPLFEMAPLWVPRSPRVVQFATAKCLLHSAPMFPSDDLTFLTNLFCPFFLALSTPVGLISGDQEVGNPEEADQGVFLSLCFGLSAGSLVVEIETSLLHVLRLSCSPVLTRVLCVAPCPGSWSRPSGRSAQVVQWPI